jgi:hypothetical protein
VRAKPGGHGQHRCEAPVVGNRIAGNHEAYGNEHQAHCHDGNEHRDSEADDLHNHGIDRKANDANHAANHDAARDHESGSAQDRLGEQAPDPDRDRSLRPA